MTPSEKPFDFQINNPTIKQRENSRGNTPEI